MSRQRVGSRHGPVAQLLIAWSPLSVILVTYAVAQWVNAPLSHGTDGTGRPDANDTNLLGFGLHVTGPVAADQAVFGVVPSVWLQQRLVDGAPHWYDAIASLIYVTHFVSLPIATAVVWFALRHRFTAWIVAVLTLTTLGVVGYLVYPAAPPWLAADRGVIGAVDRISNLGWQFLGLDRVGGLTASSQAGSNPVAAMPSLHAGTALLMALFFWPVVGPLWRLVLLGYALLMALTLVYTGEHYVVDVLMGWLTAGIAVLVAARARPGR